VKIKQFPIYKSDELGTGVYHSFVIAPQKGGVRVFILGEGRSLVFTKLLHNFNQALTYARRETNRRDKARVERQLNIRRAFI